MATKLHQRTFALVMAVLFLATSLAFSVVVIMELTGDDKEPSPVLTEQEAANGESALDANNNQTEGEEMLQGTKLAGFEPVQGVNELQKVDLVEGTGETVAEGATVTAHYTGALAKDGTIFESSKDSGQPATFPLENVIQGWQQGVPGMKVGGTRRLVIPANLAYGENGSPPAIGPNEPLVFDIELISVQ